MKHLEGIKAISFDFDGTLADSQPAKRAAWREIFEDRNPNDDVVLQKAVDDKVGNRVRILTTTFTNLGEPVEQIPALVSKYSEKFDLAIQRLIIERGLFSGTREMLETLTKTHALYVNSATPLDSVLRLCASLDITSYFRNIYGGPATKIDNYKKIIIAENIMPDELLMISDDVDDMNSAVEFGAKFVGIPNNDNKWIADAIKHPLIAKVADIIV